jgi:transposase-like protein
MADTVAVSKSAVSRETIEASERVLEDLMERRLDSWDLLVIYVDGIQLGAHEGEQKLEQLARWLERDHPSAAASLREGLAEMFTINRLALPLRHKKCLGTTNLIDSTHSGARQKTRRGDELDERGDGAAVGEDAIYDSESIRGFVGVELGEDDVPDESTILRSAISWRSMT